MTIQDIINEHKNSLDRFDIELLIANSLNKTREFILTYPEYNLTKFQISNFKFQIRRRLKGEPIAYIIGRKEFYGLDFIVNKHTLVPRPETELMVELALDEISNFQFPISSIGIIDVGTGSGCIIISIANKSVNHNNNIQYYASDISEGALKIAKSNAKAHDLNKQIKFLHGNLLLPIIEKCKLKIENSRMVILANLPYLSKEIYDSAPVDVKKFEPKSALYSAEAGLAHYRELLQQLQTLLATNDNDGLHVTLFMEISPEQKTAIDKLIKSIFPSAKIEFKKDLAKKWRLCRIDLN